MVSPEHIASRLSGTAIAENPGRQALKGLSADLIDTWFPGEMREAAVLLPLIHREPELTVLFTLRTDALPDHAGQISFPGGRRDPDDHSLEFTALREAHEEIGLAPTAVDIAGYLEPHPVITGYAVVPVVGIVTSPQPFVPEAGEVAEIFEVPLSFFLDENNEALQTRYRNGIALETYEYQYQDYRIWGATAQMLRSFLTLIR